GERSANNKDAPVWCDVDEFCRLFRQADSLRCQQPAGALRLIQAAQVLVSVHGEYGQAVSLGSHEAPAGLRKGALAERPAPGVQGGFPSAAAERLCMRTVSDRRTRGGVACRLRCAANPSHSSGSRWRSDRTRLIFWSSTPTLTRWR